MNILLSWVQQTNKNERFILSDMYVDNKRKFFIYWHGRARSFFKCKHFHFVNSNRLVKW